MHITFRKILFSCCVFAILSGCTSDNIVNQDSVGTSIVCIGASLTQGVGASKGFDYPNLLSKKVHLPVVNVGIDGNTTWEQLERMDKDVLAHNPRMVIITLRNNDIRQKISKAATVDNIKTMVQLSYFKKAMVVLVTFENKEFNAFYGNAFKDLARSERFMLISNVMGWQRDDPRYKTDKVHPNDQGYALVAERIYQRIKKLIP